VVLRRSILTMVVAVLLSAGHALAWQSAGAPNKAQAATSSVTVSDRDNHTNVDLTSGQTLIVKLPGNPSTGYTWAVSGDPAPLKLTKQFRLHRKEGSGMGAPQTEVFEFSAVKSGVTTLTLLYRRSWEYNVAPAKTFTLTVQVR
jgi:inhibitor of cysteine peptidase